MCLTMQDYPKGFTATSWSGCVIPSFLQMSKLRPRRIQEFVQGHREFRFETRNSSSSTYALSWHAIQPLYVPFILKCNINQLETNVELVTPLFLKSCHVCNLNQETDKWDSVSLQRMVCMPGMCASHKVLFPSQVLQILNILQ